MRLIIVLLLLFFTTTVSAQLTRHAAQISFAASIGTQDTTTYSCFSIQPEIFLGKYVGLKWNFDLHKRNDNVRQLHGPMGLIGGPLLMLWGLQRGSDGDSTTKMGAGIIGGLLLLALPDGISFHAPIGNSWDISPYANVLGIDFIKNLDTDQSCIRYACSFGTEFTYLLKDRVTLSLFAETRKAGGFPWAFGGGFGLGIALGERTE
ncbi:MAG: hypothetical protein ACI837_002859 [Crocinitomicaceae bacterium]|jgi:hypothetical protein